MKVHILDDEFDALPDLPCVAMLDGHDVTVWTDHETDPAKLAARAVDAGETVAVANVLDCEPLTDVQNQLLSHPNVIATPNIGYGTEDEFELLFSNIFNQITAYAQAAPINILNPTVWK